MIDPLINDDAGLSELGQEISITLAQVRDEIAVESRAANVDGGDKLQFVAGALAASLAWVNKNRDRLKQ